MSGTNFSSWYGSTIAGTFVAEFDMIEPVGTRTITSADVHFGEAIQLYSSGTDPKARIADNNITQADLDVGTIVVNTPHKIGVAYALNDIAACFDGGTAVTDTSATIPTPTMLRIGTDSDFVSAGNILNGHIRRILFWNEPLTIDELQARTVPTPPGVVTITSPTSLSVDENVTAVATIFSVSDRPVTWSIPGGADVAKFSINGWGGLTFNTPPNFEAPTDADGNNVYEVQVRATDGLTSDTKLISVTVTNVAEAVVPPGPVWAYYAPETLGTGGLTMSQWNDSAGTRHAVQANSADHPVVVANAINGYKAVRFVDATDCLALPSMTALTRGATFFVLKGDFDTGIRVGFPMRPINIADDGFYPYLDGNVYVGWMKNDRPNMGNPAQLLDAWHILSVHSAPSDYRIYINNVLFYSTVTNTPVFFAAPFIGGPQVGFGWLGHIAEIVQFSHELTTAERNAEYTRLYNKFFPVTITSVTSYLFGGGTTPFAMLTTSGGGVPTWSLVGGADVAKFSINPSTGALAFLSAPNYDVPTDADGNNVYVVQVQATDGLSSDTETISVTVIKGPAGPVWAYYAPEALGAGGTSVSQWNDSVGARHAVQTNSANQPLVAASAINGLKAIQFVDDTDGLALPSMVGLTSGAVFLVLKSVADVGGVTNGFPIQPNSGQQAHYPWNAELWVGFMRQDRLSVPDPVQPLNAWHIISLHSATNDYRFYINNVLSTSTATSTPTFSALPFISRSPSMGLGWKGHIAEVSIFSHELTTAERDAEYNRLKAKFGL